MSTTDERRVQFSNWFHKTFASPPMEFYPFAEAAWYAGQSALAQQAPTPASEPAAPVDARDALLVIALGQICNQTHDRVIREIASDALIEFHKLKPAR